MCRIGREEREPCLMCDAVPGGSAVPYCTVVPGTSTWYSPVRKVVLVWYGSASVVLC